MKRPGRFKPQPTRVGRFELLLNLVVEGYRSGGNSDEVAKNVLVLRDRLDPGAIAF